MTRSNRWIVLLVALFIGSVTRLEAQNLTPGTWTGSVVDPGGESVDVSYVVGMSGDTTQITMTAPEGHVAAFTNIHFEGTKLVFSWEAGVKIDCILDPAEGGAYSGSCTDTSGASGRMTMVPPKSDG